MQNHTQINRLGIFDSGIGGLNILDVVKNSACEEIIYIADTANLPYGDKSAAAIMAASYLVVEQLLAYRVDTIIIACHTASAIALPFLKEQFPPIKFIGMIDPTVHAAAHTTNTNHVALLATNATISHGMYEQEFKKRNIMVQNIACPELVPLIEQAADQKKINRALKGYTDAIEATVDTIILGCTHYDILYEELQKTIPDRGLITSKTSFRIPSQPNGRKQPTITLLATGERPKKFHMME